MLGNRLKWLENCFENIIALLKREKERKTISLQDVKIAFMRMSFSSAEPESEISSRIKLLLLAELILLFSLESS